MTQSETQKFWLSQDWSLCSAEIARITGKDVSTVIQARKRLKKPRGKIGDRRTENEGRPARLKIPLKEFNKNTDTALSLKYECSRERVRQLRKEAGKPSSANFWKTGRWAK